VTRPGISAILVTPGFFDWILYLAWVMASGTAEAQDPEWRARITHVSMDTSATYARAARLALPALVLALCSSRSSIAGISMPGHPCRCATATRHT
jgi:hypothetical protein